MASVGMLLKDAFRAFDFDKNGSLSIEELYGGLTWLGIPLSANEMKELFDYIDISQNGCITYREFFITFGDPLRHIIIRDRARTYFGHQKLNEIDVDDNVIDGDVVDDVVDSYVKDVRQNDKFDTHETTSVNWGVITPRPLQPQPHLPSVQTSGGRDVRLRVMAAATSLQIEILQIVSLSHIWDSSSTGARQKATIWRPNLPPVSNHRHHFCIGHYVTEGIGGQSDGQIRFYLSVTDVTNWRVFKSEHLEDVILDVLLPHPIRYVEVWRQRRGDRPLFVWQPIPPTTDYVSMGVIATTSETPPLPQACRCVPRVWVIPTTEKPKRIWNDAGSGGRAGSFWVMSRTNLLQVTEGHNQPKGDFYDFHKNTFMANHRLSEMNLKWIEGLCETTSALQMGGVGREGEKANREKERKKEPKSTSTSKLSEFDEKELKDLRSQREMIDGKEHSHSSQRETSILTPTSRRVVFCDLFSLSVDFKTNCNEILQRAKKSALHHPPK
jgi:hypothetical protein